MATPQIIAARTLDALARLAAAQDALAALVEVQFTPEPVTNKDAAVARYQEINNIAAFIEAVTAKIADAKRVATVVAPQPEPEPEAQPETPPQPEAVTEPVVEVASAPVDNPPPAPPSPVKTARRRK